MLQSEISSMSTVKAKVDLYNGSTLVQTCTCSDVLEKFSLSREGDTSKFFGFGICHKVTLDFIDLDRELELSLGNHAVVQLGDGTNFDIPFPKLYITEINRNEKNNSITCTAYDRLYNAAGHTVEELELTAPYTVEDIAEACAELLGLTLKIENVDDGSFNTSYEEGANLEEADSIRYILDAISEVTQTIYYINPDEELVFKRLDKDGDSVFTITRNDYYELDTKTNKVLSNISNITELGDNVTTTEGNGITQYIRDNPFWELREDIDTLLDNALAAVGGMSICQFTCDWSGDYRLEIGDKISLVTEDSNTVTAYFLCDTLEYSGYLGQITKWEYSENNSDIPNNPSNIGDKINQTVAKVDKVNQEITLVISNVDGHTEQFTQLNLRLDGIEGTVSSTNEDIYNQLSTKVSSTDLTTTVTSIVEENGISKVSNTIGTFDSSGLTISESNIDTSTNINANGLTIYKGEINKRTDKDTGKQYITNEAVLTVQHAGVKAENLHASTYLIIGNNSRLEDSGNRTACYWIGGN